MIILVAFAFLAGIVTVLSPCILPILPIIISSSLTGGARRPLGVISGFILSFSFFTLFLTSIVRLLNIPADSLRLFSVVVILLFGISLFIPKFQLILELAFSKLSKFTPRQTASKGFLGGFLIGLSVGLLWTPCVGPILASVISLALTGNVTSSAAIITLAYSIGTAIPMFMIAYGGQGVIKRIPALTANSAKIQKAFGLVMILVAVLILFKIDQRFQAYILDKIPEYGGTLTKFEDNEKVRLELQQMRNR